MLAAERLGHGFCRSCGRVLGCCRPEVAAASEVHSGDVAVSSLSARDQEEEKRKRKRKRNGKLLGGGILCKFGLLRDVLLRGFAKEVLQILHCRIAQLHGSGFLKLACSVLLLAGVTGRWKLGYCRTL